MVPTLIVAGIGIGVFVGGGLLRRWKRGNGRHLAVPPAPSGASCCATRAGSAAGRGQLISFGLVVPRRLQ